MPDVKYSSLKLHELLNGRFDIPELRRLCDYLKEHANAEIDYDDLGSESKSAQLHNLISWINRRNLLNKFVQLVQAHRPDITEEYLSPALFDKSANASRDHTPSSTGNDAHDAHSVRRRLKIYWYRHGWEWWVCLVGIPFGLLATLYLVERFINQVAFAYHFVFGYGDLILFSALIVFAMSIQFERSHHPSRASGDHQVVEQRSWSERAFPVIAKVYAFILLVVLGVLKHSIIKTTAVTLAGTPPVPASYSGGSLLLALASIIFATIVYSQSKKNGLEGTLQQ